MRNASIGIEIAFTIKIHTEILDAVIINRYESGLLSMLNVALQFGCAKLCLLLLIKTKHNYLNFKFKFIRYQTMYAWHITI